MSYTSTNLGSTTVGNITGNTLTTEQYRAAQMGLILQFLDQMNGASGKGLANARIVSGVAGSRPVAGSAGTVYLATDTKVPSWDDGAAWHTGGILDVAQTWTAVQTHSANVIFNALWSDAPQVTVASASAFPLPTTGNNVNVSGTTGITSFTGPATQGVIYKLQFTNATPGSVTSGGNAKLNGTFSPAQNNILYLFWDGTNAYEIGRYTGSASSVTGTTLTNSLGSDVTGIGASYVDGPTVAQGTSGTWLAVGQVTVSDTVGADAKYCKLWDGTTVIDSGGVQISPSGTLGAVVHLSGRLATPAGNIKISCKSNGTSTGAIRFNATGNSKDSTLTVVQIA